MSEYAVIPARGHVSMMCRAEPSAQDQPREAAARRFSSPWGTRRSPLSSGGSVVVALVAVLGAAVIARAVVMAFLALLAVVVAFVVLALVALLGPVRLARAG